jgi:hypothetical protein
MLVVPVPVAYILKLYPMLNWNTVPDNVFSSHLLAFDDVAISGYLTQIVCEYQSPWWMGNTTTLDEPLHWDDIMASCIAHYQCWMVRC